MPKRHVTITSWQIDNFTPSSETAELFVSFHQLVNDNHQIGQTLLGVSEPALLGEIRSGLVSDIPFDSLEVSRVLVVVHSTDSDPSYIASGIFEVTDDVSQTHEITLDFEVPVFASPKLICTLSCLPEMNLILIPGNVLAGRCEGIVNTQTPPNCVVEIRMNSIVERLPITDTVLVGGWKVSVPNNERVKIPIRFDPLSKGKIEIVFKNLDSEPKGRLIDVFQICDLVKDELVPVGSDQEGYLVVCHDDWTHPIPPKKYRQDHLLFQSREWFLQIDFVPPEWFGGSMSFGIISPVCDLAEIKTVGIENDTIMIEIGSVYMNANFVPVVGIVVRDRVHTLRGIYTVPLRDMHRLVFENETIVMSLISEEKEGAPSICVPIADERKEVLNTSHLRRCHLMIGSVKGIQTKDVDSVFVTVLSVRLDVPPVLLSSAEILKFTNSGRDGIKSAVTCERHLRFGNAVWQNDVEIDVENENWYYFILYGQLGETTTAIGHACVAINSVSASQSLICKGFDSPWFGTLDISFYKPDANWRGLWIYQDIESSKLRLFDESVKLEVQFFLNSNERSPLRTSHIWLPIKDYLPLFIRDCPPSGFLQLGLFALNGRLLSQTKLQLPDRETTTTSVGGVALILSRKKLFA